MYLCISESQVSLSKAHGSTPFKHHTNIPRQNTANTQHTGNSYNTAGGHYEQGLIIQQPALDIHACTYTCYIILRVLYSNLNVYKSKLYNHIIVKFN